MDSCDSRRVMIVAHSIHAVRIIVNKHIIIACNRTAIKCTLVRATYKCIRTIIERIRRFFKRGKCFLFLFGEFGVGGLPNFGLEYMSKTNMSGQLHGIFPKLKFTWLLWTKIDREVTRKNDWPPHEILLFFCTNSWLKHQNACMASEHHTFAQWVFFLMYKGN